MYTVFVLGQHKQSQEILPDLLTEAVCAIFQPLLFWNLFILFAFNGLYNCIYNCMLLSSAL